MARGNLSIANGVILTFKPLVLINLVVKRRGSDGTVGLENTQLLLVQDLRIGKALVNRARSQLRGANNLL